MRYNKGSKVEVLSQTDVPSGAWREAEIICGNGHSYTVKYDACLGTSGEVILEMVSRKVVRPSPPFVDVSETWVSGDIVEVYDGFCWKIATISKLLRRKCFLVRLVGSLQEFKVNKVYLRARLFWHNDEWVVIGKVSRNFKDAKKTTLRDDSFAQEENICADKIKGRLTGTLKRRLPHLDSPVETYIGSSQKFRLTEKEGRCDRVMAEKVYADDYPGEMVADICEHVSLNNRTGFSEIYVEELETSRAVECSPVISLDPSDLDCVSCSVGSCSISSNVPYELPHHYSAGDDDNFSHTESLCWRDDEDLFWPSEAHLAEEIHRLELQAYRCTIEALHASGPLSWEQETLVTNLRLSLHISNDEHLMELRNLVSSDTSVLIR